MPWSVQRVALRACLSCVRREVAAGIVLVQHACAARACALRTRDAMLVGRVLGRARARSLQWQLAEHAWRSAAPDSDIAASRSALQRCSVLLLHAPACWWLHSVGRWSTVTDTQGEAQGSGSMRQPSLAAVRLPDLRARVAVIRNPVLECPRSTHRPRRGKDRKPWLAPVKVRCSPGCVPRRAWLLQSVFERRPSSISHPIRLRRRGTRRTC